MAPAYLEHFGLAEAPFSIAPDPRYLYLSAGHREALAHLLYGLENNEGFVLLTGEVGTGKTTLCRGLFEQLPGDCDVALIFNPRLTAPELLATICEEFRITFPPGNASSKVFIDRLTGWLLGEQAQKRRPVLVIDEAQALGADLLEQIRLLTNLETTRHKLLNIILIGQPQLRDLLGHPELTQLSQRIVARYHLGPLSRGDSGAYIVHRLAVAGAREDLFTPAAVDLLHRLSGGIPRRLNALADRALLGAYTQWLEKIGPQTVREAGREVLGADAEVAAGRRMTGATAAGFGALCGAAATAAAYLYVNAAAFAHPVAAVATGVAGAAGCIAGQ